MKKINKYAVAVSIGLALLPLLAMAQPFRPEVPIIVSPSNIKQIVNSVFNWLSGIVFTISLITLLYAAILFMTAGASETIHGKAKTVLIYAVVGLAVAILTFSFKPFLETFFGGNF